MRMPNSETMVVKHTTLLPFPQPPLATQKYDVFLLLKQPLLSLGHFYDSGFMATLHIEIVQLTKDGIATLLGTIYHTIGLYFITLQG